MKENDDNEINSSRKKMNEKIDKFTKIANTIEQSRERG